MSTNALPVTARTGRLTVNAGAAWTVPVRAIDAKNAYGRDRLLVEPVEPARGPAIWVDSDRVSLDTERT